MTATALERGAQHPSPWARTHQCVRAHGNRSTGWEKHEISPARERGGRRPVRLGPARQSRPVVDRRPASADSRGYASLQRGASSTEKASYYFQGSPNTASRTHTFRGPYEDDWQATDDSDWAQLVWAPCGVQRNFHINTELRVNAGTSSPGATSYMTMDSTDGDISTVYHLAWKECPAD